MTLPQVVRTAVGVPVLVLASTMSLATPLVLVYLFYYRAEQVLWGVLVMCVVGSLLSLRYARRGLLADLPAGADASQLDLLSTLWAEVAWVAGVWGGITLRVWAALRSGEALRRLGVWLLIGLAGAPFALYCLLLAVVTVPVVGVRRVRGVLGALTSPDEARALPAAHLVPRVVQVRSQRTGMGNAPQLLAAVAFLMLSAGALTADVVRDADALSHESVVDGTVQSVTPRTEGRGLLLNAGDKDLTVTWPGHDEAAPASLVSRNLEPGDPVRLAVPRDGVGAPRVLWPRHWFIYVGMTGFYLGLVSVVAYARLRAIRAAERSTASPEAPSPRASRD